MASKREDSTTHPLLFADADSPGDQANSVADWVIKLHEAGAEWGDIAILMRSVRHNIDELLSELESRGVPVGGSIANNGLVFLTNFVVPVLRWLVTAAKWREGKDDEEMEALSSQLEEAVSDEVGDFNKFWSAINDWRDDLQVGGTKAYDLRSSFFSFIDAAGLSVGLDDSERLNGIALASQYMRAMEEVYRRRIPGSPRKNPVQIISDLIFRITVSSADYGETRPLIQDKAKITLTTVHKAKGLEWPHVIVPNIQAGLFPLRPRKRSTIAGGEALSQKYGTTLQEEFRIMYVAATRARDTLLLVAPGSDIDDSHPVRGPFRDSGGSNLIESTSELPEVENLEALSVAADEYLSIGLADLLIHDDCGFEYGLRRIAGIQPSIGQELGYGLGLHELIRERVEAKSDWSLEKFRERSAVVVRLPYMSDADEARSQLRIAEIAHALQKLGLLDGNYKSELRTSLLLGRAVVQGTIDGVLEVDGKVVVRDWKTNVHEHLRDKYDRQLALYAMALGDKGVKLSSAEYIDASASSKSGSIQKVEVDVSSAEVSKLRQQMEKVTIEIAEGKVTPRPSIRTCSSCDVSRICSYRMKGVSP